MFFFFFGDVNHTNRSMYKEKNNNKSINYIRNKIKKKKRRKPESKENEDEEEERQLKAGWRSMGIVKGLRKWGHFITQP